MGKRVMKMFPRRSLQAFTLVEMGITIVITGLALTTGLKAFSLLAGRNADGLMQTKTLDLAQLYLDEILAVRFDESTGVGGTPTFTGCRITNDGENRSGYDDVDDYDAINNEVPAFVDADLAAQYDGFSVSVSVSCDNSVGVNPGGAKRIALSIRAPDGLVSHFSVYRGELQLLGA